jgi:hypothetical protein
MPDNRSWLQKHWIDLVLVTLLLVVIGISLALPPLEHWQDCSQHLTSMGKIASLCRPYEITDIPALCVVGLLLILGWRFVSQVGLPGGFTLTRRVKATEALVKTQSERQQLHEEQLNDLRLQINSTAMSQAIATVNVNMVDTQKNLRELAFKEAEFLPDEANLEAAGVAPETAADTAAGMHTLDRDFLAIGEPPLRVFTEHARKLDSEDHSVQSIDNRISLYSTLVDQWATLTDELQIQTSPPIPPTKSMPPEVFIELRTQFLSLFREELDGTSLIRNRVAHGEYVPDDQISDSIQATKKLRTLWRGKIRETVRARRPTS